MPPPNRPTLPKRQVGIRDRGVWSVGGVEHVRAGQIGVPVGGVRIDRRDGGRRGAVEVFELRLWSIVRSAVGRDLHRHHSAHQRDQHDETSTHPSTPLGPPDATRRTPMQRA